MILFRVWFVIGVLALLVAWFAPAQAASDRACVGQAVTTTAETQRYDVSHHSTPWTVWLKVDSGTPTVTVKGYGPCLDQAKGCIGGANALAVCTVASECPGGTCTSTEASCTRPGPFTLATLNTSNVTAGGCGPIEAVSFQSTTGTSRVQFCGSRESGIQ